MKGGGDVWNDEGKVKGS